MVATAEERAAARRLRQRAAGLIAYTGLLCDDATRLNQIARFACQNAHVIISLGRNRIMNEGPGFWMNEVSGVLRPVVMAYLEGAPLTPQDLAIMRAYLRQWIASPYWRGPEVAQLRQDVDAITSRATLKRWLDRADSVGIDPL